MIFPNRNGLNQLQYSQTYIAELNHFECLTYFLKSVSEKFELVLIYALHSRNCVRVFYLSKDWINHYIHSQ